MDKANSETIDWNAIMDEIDLDQFSLKELDVYLISGINNSQQVETADKSVQTDFDSPPAVAIDLTDCSTIDLTESPDITKGGSLSKCVITIVDETPKKKTVKHSLAKLHSFLRSEKENLQSEAQTNSSSLSKEKLAWITNNRRKSHSELMAKRIRQIDISNKTM